MGLPFRHLHITGWSFQQAVLVFHVLKSSQTGSLVWKDAWFHFSSLLWSSCLLPMGFEVECLWHVSGSWLIGEKSEPRWNSSRKLCSASHTHSTVTAKWDAGRIDYWWICSESFSINNSFLRSFGDVVDGRSNYHFQATNWRYCLRKSKRK